MRRTLILWNTAALLVLFGLLGGIVRGIVRAGMYAGIDRELSLRLTRFLERPAERENPRPRGGGGGGGGQGRGNPFKPHLFDQAGHSINPVGNYPLWDRDAFTRAPQVGRLTTTVRRDGEPLRVLSLPVREGGQLIGVAQMPYPVIEVERAVALLDRALLALVPLVVLAAWGGALLLTRRVLRPVVQLTQSAARLGAENLSERLPVTGDDEFATLATTFNGMLARLEVAFEQQRRFTADASHELKTPLTRIKGLASMAQLVPDRPERLLSALRDIDRSADTMAQLVQDLLLLARGDSGRLGEGRTELMARVVLEQARERVWREGLAQVSLTIQPEYLTLRANEAELLRVLVNLLENALRHTPADGQVSVTAQHGQLVIADTGCGIAPEHHARLGERFYRVDSARARQDGGTGLGLAICKSIVLAHGGTLRIESAPGQGTRVLLDLPN